MMMVVMVIMVMMVMMFVFVRDRVLIIMRSLTNIVLVMVHRRDKIWWTAPPKHITASPSWWI